MSNDMTPLNPGQTHNIFNDGHLSQTQHKGTHVDIVDHTHGPGEKGPHVITTVDRNGGIDIDFG
jgi:hypothetical protein